MNMNFWAEFWAAMPGEMRVILGLFVGATIHFVRNKTQGVSLALTGSFVAILAGAIITVIVASVKGWDFKEYWFISSPSAFVANYLLGGMEVMGKQFEKSPVKWIINVGIETYLDIRTKIKGDKNNDNPTV